MTFLEQNALWLGLIGALCSIIGVVLAFQKGKARSQEEHNSHPSGNSLGLAELLIFLGLIIFMITLFLAFQG